MRTCFGGRAQLSRDAMQCCAACLLHALPVGLDGELRRPGVPGSPGERPGARHHIDDGEGRVRAAPSGRALCCTAFAVLPCRLPHAGLALELESRPGLVLARRRLGKGKEKRASDRHEKAAPRHVCVDVGASGAGSILPRRFARGRVVGLQKLNRTHLSARRILFSSDDEIVRFSLLKIVGLN